MIGLLNGLTSLVNHGGTFCEKGLVHASTDASSQCELYKGWQRNRGQLTYSHGEQHAAHLRPLKSHFLNAPRPEAIYDHAYRDRCVRKTWADSNLCEVNQGTNSNEWSSDSIEDAKALCQQCSAQLNSSGWTCGVLWDYACDGRSWRVCESTRLHTKDLDVAYTNALGACGVEYKPNNASYPHPWVRPKGCWLNQAGYDDEDCLEPAPKPVLEACESDCDSDDDCSGSEDPLGITYKTGAYCNNRDGTFFSGWTSAHPTNDYSTSYNPRYNYSELNQASEQCASNSNALSFIRTDNPAGTPTTSNTHQYCSYAPGPKGPTNATAALVVELSLLLTGGKLAERTKRIVIDAYDARFNEVQSPPAPFVSQPLPLVSSPLPPALSTRSSTLARPPPSHALSRPLTRSQTGSTVEALKMAEHLMLAAPEFHATNLPQPTDEPRGVAAEISNQTDGRTYKAIVVVFLAGGLDSFNLIVPHSGCKPNQARVAVGLAADDFFGEYSAVRGVSALNFAELLPIDATRSPLEQPCSTMSLHPNLPEVKKLYDAGDAVVVANVGSLVEPMTKAQYETNTRRFPPGLFAHNIQQRCAQNLHADYGSAKGVLGRTTTVLESQAVPYKTKQYSLAGSLKIVEGGASSPEMLHKTEGTVTYKRYSSMVGKISNLTGVKAKSIYAETYSDRLETAMLNAYVLDVTMGNVSLSQDWNDGEDLSRQLMQVSKVIKSRHVLGGQRDVFVVKMTGFDTHNLVTGAAWERMPWIDDAMAKFSAEMKNEGVWQDVVMPYISDFGRTITSNGEGTDHAWAGNMLILGGGLNGSRILGQYPSGLDTDAEARTSRGRLIPTMPWEAMWDPIVQWFGVEPANLGTVLPNRGNFGECACTGACDPDDAFIFTPGKAVTEAMCGAGGGVWTSSLVTMEGLFGDGTAHKDVVDASPPSPPSPPPAISDPANCPSGCCTVLYTGSPGEKCMPVPIWDFSSWSHPGGGSVTTVTHSLCGAVKFNWWDKGSHASHDPYHTATFTSASGGATYVGDYMDPACGSGR